LRLGEGVSLETSPITTKYSPWEDLIQRPLEEKSIIETCPKSVIKAQNPRISLIYSSNSEKKIFELKIEGFFTCLSPDPLYLQDNVYKVVEYLYELENHKYVDPIKSGFQTIMGTPYSLIIRQLLIPY